MADQLSATTATPRGAAEGASGSARRVPLEQRVRRSLLLLVSGALLVGIAALSSAEVFEALEEREELARSMAHLLAENASAGLARPDAGIPPPVLGALRDEASIVSAAIYDIDGRMLAGYPQGDPHANVDHAHEHFAGAGTSVRVQRDRHDIAVTHPVRDGDRVLGYVHLDVSLAPAYENIVRFTSVTALILLAVLLAAVPVARRLVHRIVAPVSDLATTMSAVASDAATAPRAVKRSDDEIGDLVDRFNELLNKLTANEVVLRERQIDLETEVAARTSELLESNQHLGRAVVELEEARDAAQHASEAKSQFLANMSHEIRSPLNGVIGMAELLRNTALDERQSHFCRTILTSSHALLAVLNDVLDLSKIEAGSMQLEQLEFDLQELVEEAIQVFAESAARRGIELVASSSFARHQRVVGDPVRLRQVLINLLSNAVKFTDQGEVVLEVVDGSADGFPDRFHFEVRDTGIGMSSETQQRVFDAFVQADGSTSRRYGGTGLGLAISHSMVTLLGGELRVDSAPDRGSRFAFAIPLAAARAARSPRSFAIRDARVLVLDAHEASAASVQRQLLNWGAVPVTAHDLADARSVCEQAAQRRSLAALVANYERLGAAAAEQAHAWQQLRALAAEFDLPLVVYASVAAFGTLTADLGARARSVAKPLRQSDLFDALSDLLQLEAPVKVAALRPTSDLDGVRVLLVEDNPVNQEVASEHLRELGCQVTLAGHGGEALAAFEQQRFDVVLMDCQMPVLDGYEATRAIRKHEAKSPAATGDGADRHRRTPIVALTANALKGDRDRCLLAGMDDFLPKPFRLDDLRRTLARWSGRGAAPDAGVAPTSAPLIDEAAWKQLGDLAARTEGFLTRLLGALRDEVVRLHGLLVDSSTSATELAFVAHRVKSAANSVGALVLGELLAQVERHARATGDDEPGALRSLQLTRLREDTAATLRATMAELAARSGMSLALDVEPQPPIEQPASEPAASTANAVVASSAAAAVPANVKTQQASLLVPAPAGSSDATPVSVLIADDDTVTRSIVSDWLRRDGYRVVEAADGERAEQCFADERFDVVLLDVMMPVRDGFETCAALRAHPAGHHVPILMLTGLDDTESIHRAYEVGATDFVIKPIAEEILRQRLRYIQRAQASAARLRESEDRLRRTQDAARVSYWEYEPATGALRLGEGARQILGFDDRRQAFRLDDLKPFLVEDDRGFFDDLEAGVADLPTVTEYRLHDRYGTEILMSQRLARVVDDRTGQLRWHGTVQDITEHRRAEQRIYRISHFDTVTGLPNQNLLRKSMIGLLALAARRQARLAFLMIDAGEQQLVASSLGHDANDRYLLELASRLRTQLRGSDLVAPLDDGSGRTGPAAAIVDQPRAALVHGDRFAAVLNDVGDNADITRLCERLIGALSAPIELGDETLFPKVRIGISVFPDDGDDYATLQQHALTALHQHDEANVTSWHWYQHERDAAARQRLALERDLRFAVERGELRVFFQPRVHATTHQPVGMEALVRWQREGQWIPPGKFVPIAEQTGVVTQLGDHVLTRATALLGNWLGRGIAPLTLSVNVSGQQFRESNVPAMCAAALERYRVPGDALELELTEGILIDATDDVMQQLHAVASLGVRLALDDFGTGFSSLAYLSRFPLNVLKIDREFVQHLLDNRQNQVIVRSTIDLAHELGLTVVAEGVELPAQAEWLAAHGCDELQGFLFSKAIPPEEFEQWVLTHLPRVSAEPRRPSVRT